MSGIQQMFTRRTFLTRTVPAGLAVSLLGITPLTAAASGSWSGWKEVPGNGTTDVSVAVVSYNQKLYVFGKGINDNGEYVNVFNGSSWSGWRRIEGTTNVALAATTYQGRLFLFGKGIDDNGEYVKTFNGSTWSSWKQL